MNLYIGTFSNKSIIAFLKEQEEVVVTGLSDAEIEKSIINTGRTKIGLTHFFAKNISQAKTMAKEMGLKNFSRVSNNIVTIES